MSNIALAFVNASGVVTLVLNTDQSLVDNFTNSVHIIDTTNIPGVSEGWLYDGTNFTEPAPVPVPTPVHMVDNETLEKILGIENIDKNLAKNRQSICDNCPFYDNASKTCAECGCYMPKKTLLVNSECPLGKW